MSGEIPAQASSENRQRSREIPTQRLFFALWPDEATRERLAHATRKAVRASGGRPIPVDNLHATLLFIGSVADTRIPELEEVAAALRFEPFSLDFDRIDHWAKPGVLCVTATQTPVAAAELAAALLRNVAAAGFATDVKPFRAHVTVARKVVKPHALGPIASIRWDVDGFALVQSQTLPQGSRYTVRRRW